YMANAAGRLLGTVLSGVTYQLGGLALMLGVATFMVVSAALTASRLR
ncbi:MAG: MFS transporter, partial [Pseudomonadota bacterium]